MVDSEGKSGGRKKKFCRVHINWKMVISFFSVHNYWLILASIFVHCKSHLLFGCHSWNSGFQFQGCLIYWTCILCQYQFRIDSSSMIQRRHTQHKIVYSECKSERKTKKVKVSLNTHNDPKRCLDRVSSSFIPFNRHICKGVPVRVFDVNAKWEYRKRKSGR